jgi:hypothetical protein
MRECPKREEHAEMGRNALRPYGSSQRGDREGSADSFRGYSVCRLINLEDLVGFYVF